MVSSMGCFFLTACWVDDPYELLLFRWMNNHQLAMLRLVAEGNLFPTPWQKTNRRCTAIAALVWIRRLETQCSAKTVLMFSILHNMVQQLMAWRDVSFSMWVGYHQLPYNFFSFHHHPSATRLRTFCGLE